MKISGIFNIGIILHTDKCIENVISDANGIIQFLSLYFRKFVKQLVKMKVTYIIVV